MALLNYSSGDDMKLDVIRFTSDEDTTLSQIYVDSKFICFGLEDEYRETKVSSETRIPAGEYKIEVRNYGGFNSRYQRKFGKLHQGMLEIKDIPDFTDVLIHIGNTDDNTAGCLLVGYGAISRQGNMSIQYSTDAYKDLYEQVIMAAYAGNLTIDFIDSDRG
jgi:hypothetical protein